MAEAVGSAFPAAGARDPRAGAPIQRSISERRSVDRLAVGRLPKKKTPRNARRFHIDRKLLSNYFDTDFLKARSIFSLVASQQAWLA